MMCARYVFPLAVVVVVACAPTDVGNPPLDVDDMLITPLPPPVGQPGMFPVEVEGAAGAVSPPEGSVTIVGLMSPAFSSTSELAADGSFRLVLEQPSSGFADGERFRIFASRDNVRSNPIDFEFLTGQALAPVANALDPCVEIDRIVDAAESARIFNGCDGPLTLSVGRTFGGVSAELSASTMEPEAEAFVSAEITNDSRPMFVTVELLIDGAATGSAFLTVFETG